MTVRCTLGGFRRVSALLLVQFITVRMTDLGRISILTSLVGRVKNLRVLTILNVPPNTEVSLTATCRFTL